MTAVLEAVLRRHRAITIAALVVLTLLAWAWMFAGAGMGMEPMMSLGAFPAAGQPMAAMAAPMPWTAGRYLLTFSMWWVMMVAMMVPSAAPAILIFAGMSRK